MIDIITNSDGIPDLDAMAAASREKAKQTYPFKYVGREWVARNSVPFGTLARGFDMENADLLDVLNVAAQFIVEDQREAFKEAILDSEEVDITELTMLSEFFNSRVREATGNAAT